MSLAERQGTLAPVTLDEFWGGGQAIAGERQVPAFQLLLGGNAQGILPRPGFLAGVRAMTREFGALLMACPGSSFSRPGEHATIERPDLRSRTQQDGVRGLEER